ncbi:MAG TPA: hypothetical protein VG268_09175 [Streptosporangiaceae bacterium]|nr:hypothetical protein [Streptosporangiaceae bacterium]
MDEPNELEREPGQPRVSRRIFLTGVAGIGAAAGLARTGQGLVRPQLASAATGATGATAPSGPPTSTLPLPATTEPEQLLLTGVPTRPRRSPCRGGRPGRWPSPRPRCGTPPSRSPRPTPGT